MSNNIPLDDFSPLFAFRFWTHVEDSGDCRIWSGHKDQAGYGRLKKEGRSVAAHRVAYTIVKGAIPEGLVIDHLCRNHACVNPEHLEAVTNAENVRRGVEAGFGPGRQRGTACGSGHEFTDENTLTVTAKSGKATRACKTCHRNYHREYQRKLRATSPDKHRGPNSPAGVIPHGTISGYVYHKCRCAECKAVKAARARAERIAKQFTNA